MLRVIFCFFLLLTSLSCISQAYRINLTCQQAEKLGQLIWKNEGQQKQENLTTWNKNEDFPSLGLGHFIWYPGVEKGPFKEQFPELLQFFKNSGVVLPAWLARSEQAPWKSREQFYREFDQPQLTELRLLLNKHSDLQVQFIIKRLETGIPLILLNSNKTEMKVIHYQLARLTALPEGIFALLDYINFKGEGVLSKEAYQGQGWGLKQVLLTMPLKYDDPLRAFALSADEVLTRRVKNAPSNELHWLKGWRVRVHGYQSIMVN
ncbi:conserved hypothetical protein [Psychromonas ingrahamii 37]|uniref:Uncharacterized protein n=1 Tax=Psychromonas ingrahamii (strain DSM 17664 / CCUG 51855 / 37) TaxID=357804 RepID=A1SX26_PSYIN|nr:hypothetical protein [Psychromonas ingrahamii]ABM04041.1 conserved hypothetical protein [Psychromonas ingrahamii 37]